MRERERSQFDLMVECIYKAACTCTPVCRAPTRITSWHYCLRKKIRNNQKVPLGSSLGLSLALLSSAHARVAHVDLLVSLYVGSGWPEKYSAIYQIGSPCLSPSIYLLSCLPFSIYFYLKNVFLLG
jgi:hypothetical protein